MGHPVDKPISQLNLAPTTATATTANSSSAQELQAEAGHEEGHDARRVDGGGGGGEQPLRVAAHRRRRRARLLLRDDFGRATDGDGHHRGQLQLRHRHPS